MKLQKVSHSKSRTHNLRHGLMILAGLVLVAFGLLRLQQNFNGGQYYAGRGSLRVSDCRSDSYAYECTGNFNQNGGMVSVKDSTVKVDSSYSPGDLIKDLFPHYSYENGEITAVQLQTIGVRHSVVNNILNGLSVLAGATLVVFAVWRIGNKK